MKARLTAVQVQPVIVADDGTTLHPVQAPPLSIPAPEWEAFAAEGMGQVLADVQAQLDARTATND